jgi:hypothetical protein
MAPPRADSYLGDTLVWEFADDGERRAYRASQWSKLSFLLNFFLVPLAFVMVALVLSLLSPLLILVLVGVMFLPVIARWLVTTRHGITALELRLHPKWFRLTERYGAPHWFRDRPLGRFSAAAVKGGQWTNEGCYIELNRHKAPVNHVVLPIGLFKSQASVDALLCWAEVHGITIEGVPPLPGGYVRQIEERRGL